MAEETLYLLSDNGQPVAVYSERFRHEFAPLLHLMGYCETPISADRAARLPSLIDRRILFNPLPREVQVGLFDLKEKEYESPAANQGGVRQTTI